MNTLALSQPKITILDQVISMFEGLYSLNDLHKASGGEAKHKPSNFMRNEETQALISEIEHFSDLSSEEKTTAYKAINGGAYRGTYVCKELVYRYAMWVSAKFSLIVIRAFDALVRSGDRLSTKADRVPLKDAVNMLVAKTANLNYSDAYKMVHQKMGIGSVKELAVEQIPAAVEYVHGLVVQAVTIHGELLPRAEEAPPHIVMIPIDTRKDGQHLIVVSDGLVGKYRPTLTSDASDYDKPWGTLLKAEFAAQ